MRSSIAMSNRRLDSPADDSASDKASARWSREWIYFAAIVVAWSFIPLIRRLLDFRNGAFNPVQVTSLIPFVMMIPLAFFFLKKGRLARLSPALRIFSIVWGVTFLYGLLVAVAFGEIAAAAFEFIQYILPAFAAIWLATQDLPMNRTLSRLAVIILPCAGIAALYGIVQWVNPPPWDVMWVQGSEFTSVGPPLPFQMRLFSSLNSPGFRSVWTWPFVASMGAALLLTLVREAWIAVLVGVTAYLVLSPKRAATFPSIVVFIVLIGFLVTSLPAMLGSGPDSDVITSRISTLGDVSHDTSALTRQAEISDALSAGLENPIGSGLGAIGAASRLTANPQSVTGNVLDSGYLARFIELGWLGILGYLFVCLGAPAVFVVGLSNKNMGPEAKVTLATATAMCVALVWGDAAGDTHLGVEGFFFWIAIGIGSLALQSAAKAPSRSRIRSLRPIS
jgi:putative inorganic carbon (HCO3(-)) transporter